jgi:hypothetical protein
MITDDSLSKLVRENRKRREEAIRSLSRLTGALVTDRGAIHDFAVEYERSLRDELERITNGYMEENSGRDIQETEDAGSPLRPDS